MPREEVPPAGGTSFSCGVVYSTGTQMPSGEHGSVDR